MSNSPADVQRLLGTKRQQNRPSYFNMTSNSTVQISFEFETYLILLDRSTKQNVITRLRKASQQISAVADRDLLELQAADYENRSASAINSDLSLDVGDYTSFANSELQGTSLPEVAQLVDDLGATLGASLFQREQSYNDIVATSLIQSDLQTKTVSRARKRQLDSWVNVFITYLSE